MRVIDFMNMTSGDYHDKQVEYNMTGLHAEIRRMYPNDPNPVLTDPKYKEIVYKLPFTPLIGGGMAEVLGIHDQFLTLELWKDLSNGYCPTAFLPKDSELARFAIQTPRGEMVKLNKNATPISETGEYRPDLAPKKRRIGTEFVFAFGQNTSNVITALAIEDPSIETKFANKMNDIFRDFIIREMERDAFVRMGTDGKDLDYASQLLVVAFQHIENRSTEPFRHFHFDLMNTAIGQDGEFYAVMNDLIIQNKEKYSALFMAEAKEWFEQELGLSFQPVYLDEDRDNEYLKDFERNITSWDVEDKFVPQSLRDHLGARTKEMDALMKQQGKSGFLAEEIARKESRQEKTELSPSELKEGWADLYAKHGFNAKHIAQHQNFNQSYDPAAQLPEAKQLISNFIRKHKSQNLVTELQLGELPPAELLIANFLRKHKEVACSEDQWKAHCVKQLLGVCNKDRALEYAEDIFKAEFVQHLDKEKVPYYDDFLNKRVSDPTEYRQKQIHYARDVNFVPKVVIQMERDTVEGLKARQDETGFMLNKQAVAQAIMDFEASMSKPGKPFQFKAGQKNAVMQAMTESGAVINIAGRAGSGKSTLLKVVLQEYEKAGYNVWGTSTSSTATKGLAKDTGMKAGQFGNTAELLMMIGTGKIEMNSKTVLMMDEAGMSSTEELYKIVQIVNKAGAKIILTGEKEQLQSVGFGGLFKTMNENFITAPVTDINRQKEDWQRDMVHDFANGKAQQAIHKLHSEGKVIIKKTDKGRLAQLVSDYTKDENDFKEKLIIAPTNQDVERINLAIRAELQKTGKLPKEEVTLQGKDGMERQFAIGDRLIITKNQKTDDVDQVKLSNSETGRVIGIGRLSNGKPNSLKIEMDDGKQHFININKEHNIKHGYCSTVHKSQGQTKNHAYYWVSPSLNNLHQAYVACSRHRHQLKMYLSEDMVETLAQKMEGKAPTKGMKALAQNIAKKQKLDLPPSALESFNETRTFLDKYATSKPGKTEKDVLNNFADIAKAMSQTQFKKTSYDYQVADGTAVALYEEARAQKYAKGIQAPSLEAKPNQAAKPVLTSPQHLMNKVRDSLDSIKSLPKVQTINEMQSKFIETATKTIPKVKKVVRERSL